MSLFSQQTLGKEGGNIHRLLSARHAITSKHLTSGVGNGPWLLSSHGSSAEG